MFYQYTILKAELILLVYRLDIETNVI
jgi:hypothetical protein